jgi:predicted transglutaminase-like cysteine proteinase
MRPSFLGSVEVGFADHARFPQWTTVVARHRAQSVPAATRPCDGGSACGDAAWRRLIASARHLDRDQQLVVVHRAINARPYAADMVSGGTPDHWSTPRELLARAGDCEDFALAKYMALKELGWGDDAVRVVAVRDVRSGVGHAVVVARHAGRSWVLDNRLAAVTELERLSHYRPVYSINDSGWWLHRTARST